MYIVLDTGRPADVENTSLTTKGIGWDNALFFTWEDAVAYANNWLGRYGPGTFEVGVPFYYYGNDEVTIRKIELPPDMTAYFEMALMCLKRNMPASLGDELDLNDDELDRMKVQLDKYMNPF